MKYFKCQNDLNIIITENKRVSASKIQLIFFILISFISCQANTLDSGKIFADDKIIDVEIAYTNHDRSNGLMHREELAPDSGMIFVFPYDRKLSFWMKNTSIPLSIAYISSDFIIREIKQMTPFSLSPVKSRNSVSFALEMDQGYFKKNNIKVGDKLIFSDTILQVLEKAED